MTKEQAIASALTGLGAEAFNFVSRLIERATNEDDVEASLVAVALAHRMPEASASRAAEAKIAADKAKHATDARAEEHESKVD